MMVPVTKKLKVIGEDRFFIWNTPVLRSLPGTVTANYIYWQFLDRRISTMTRAAPLEYRGPVFRREMQKMGGTLLQGYIQFFPEYGFFFLVLFIPVRVTFTAGGTYELGYSVGLDLGSRAASAELIGSFTASLRVAAFVDLFIVRAGVEVIASFFSVAIIPYLTVSLLDHLETCFGIKGTFQALRIDIAFFYQIFFCFGCEAKWCCKLRCWIE